MTPFEDWVSGTSLGQKITSCRESRKLVIVIVAIALFLDNMLLTTVVPIIPKFLYEMEHPNETLFSKSVEIDQPLLDNHSDISNNNDNATFPTISPREIIAKEKRHADLVRENEVVALMFASKAFVQLIANPFIGPLTHRVGYAIPMFVGFMIMFLSTIIFAFGRSTAVLYIARALQGIGSSCSSVSGMGMLAEQYPDDNERGNAMGVALGGLALGVLCGPPFGGFMYKFFGKTLPFLILSLLALGDGLLQLLILQPGRLIKRDEEAPSLKELVMDPYIILASGAITFANMGIAMLEPSLTIWMMETMNASELEQGLIFLPASIFYLIGTNIFGPLGARIGRWLAAMIGLIVISACLFTIPFSTRITQLILPNAGLGFAIGMVDSSMMPELGFLVDIRHKAIYGSVYAIGDVAFCLGYAIGPTLSAVLIQKVGFLGMACGVSFLTLLYAPLLLILKSATNKEERTSLLPEQNSSSVRYVSYQNEEEEEE